MKITFYKCSADKIIFDKTNYNTQKGSSLNVKYKENTDLLRPIILVKPSDIMDKDINYIRVMHDESDVTDTTTVDRYYFVNEITFSQQYVILHCEVDVLMTFKDEIAKLSGIVERNAFLWNMYLTDTKLKCFNLQRIQTFPWTDASGNAKGFFDGSGNKTASYVLTMSGGGDESEEQEEGDG